MWDYAGKKARQRSGCESAKRSRCPSWRPRRPNSTTPAANHRQGLRTDVLRYKMMSSLPQGESLDRIQCQWCQSMNVTGATACRACGAPLDVRNLVSESGWREAPRIRDMTEIHFSSSTCQVEGE